MKPSPALAFVFAHPGHELRVHHWLESAGPVVHVLTDGSGSQGRSRLPSTTRVLSAAGARAGRCFGQFTDRELYALLLGRRFDVFRDVTQALADDLDREGIETVAGEAIEGFNPGHDAARLLVNAAVCLVGARGRLLRNLEFDVDGQPGRCADDDGYGRLHLGDAALSRKIAAARGYEEMSDEVTRRLERHGDSSLRCECLRPAPPSLVALARLKHPLSYEVHGENKVAAGIYAEVVRLEEHLLPLARNLQAFTHEAAS